jgi:hypothetical protein
MSTYFYTTLIIMAGIMCSAVAAYLGARHGQKVNLRRKVQGKHRNTELDKRLEIHQLAFSLSLQLPSAAHDPENNSDLLHQCDNFWKNNCLFMVPKVRESFRLAYQTARFYPTYRDNYEKGKITDAELKEAWYKITKSTYDIVESIGFRWLGDLEPISREQNFLRRASDWEKKSANRRRKSN